MTLIYFPVIVCHQTGITMFQFGLCQDITNLPHNLDKVHHTDMRGHSDTNWAGNTNSGLQFGRKDANMC